MIQNIFDRNLKTYTPWEFQRVYVFLNWNNVILATNREKSTVSIFIQILEHLCLWRNNSNVSINKEFVFILTTIAPKTSSMTNLHTTSWLLYLKNIFDTQSSTWKTSMCLLNKLACSVRCCDPIITSYPIVYIYVMKSIFTYHIWFSKMCNDSDYLLNKQKLTSLNLWRCLAKPLM